MREGSWLVLGRICGNYLKVEFWFLISVLIGRLVYYLCR